MKTKQPKRPSGYAVAILPHAKDEIRAFVRDLHAEGKIARVVITDIVLKGIRAYKN